MWSLLAKNWYSLFCLMERQRAYSILLEVQEKKIYVTSKKIIYVTLFIISADVLFGDLNVIMEEDKYKGFDLPKWSDKINHLPYADDIIICIFFILYHYI